ncbi:MAG: hypothetical protein ASUL_06914 [Candidatus Aramenus sulfurataquae]|uniref:Uncharacterized protein n=1 Tax=Candidatus Aramenus sulfurataquae TaxID=1326980 RepID=W7L5I8_9CREN|nr:MAG: hypothetical protein ASUL_06914 [Candidatus Aramenus sulfurataquae]
MILLASSAVTYVVGDPLTRLLSYQGPILGGGLLGWYVLNSSVSKDQLVEVDGSLMPAVSYILRKRTWLAFVVFSVLVTPWLIPPVAVVVEHSIAFSITAFISQLVGGFVLGYFLSSLKFMEKVVLFSLGFAGDIFYVMLLYIFSTLFQVSQSVLVNDVLGFIYGIKFTEGIVFAVYVIKKVNAI